MQTTARDILHELDMTLPDTAALTLTDAHALMGEQDHCPMLEAGGYAVALADDRGPDGTDAAEGYTWTRYQLTPHDGWVETGYGHAADECTAHEDVTAWWNGLPQ